MSAVIGGATKGAARFLDGRFGGTRVSDAMSPEIATYEDRKRKIDWATGRLAVIGYAIIVAFLVLVAASFSNGGGYGFAWAIASIIHLIALVNVFVPFVTVCLRKIPYRMLDREYIGLKHG